MTRVVFCVPFTEERKKLFALVEFVCSFVDTNRLKDKQADQGIAFESTRFCGTHQLHLKLERYFLKRQFHFFFISFNARV